MRFRFNRLWKKKGKKKDTQIKAKHYPHKL